LRVDQLPDRILDAPVPDKLRTAEIHNGTFASFRYPFEIVIQEGVVEPPRDNRSRGIPKRLPEEHIDVMAIDRPWNIPSGQYIPKNQAVELALILQGMNNHSSLREVSQFLQIFFVRLGLGQSPVEQSKQGGFLLFI
jgi:hypothetical protein